MLKLTYNLKCGFKEAYVVLKNQEFDLSDMIDLLNHVPEELADEYPEDSREVITEESFYNEYRDNIDALLDLMESTGYYTIWWESTTVEVAHKYFDDVRRERNMVPGIWKPSKIRLVYEQE